MAGKTSGTCSPAAPLSRPLDARRRAERAAGPPERPGKHKRSTRATQEEHKRAIGYGPAISWPVPRLSVALGGLCSASQLSGFIPNPCPLTKLAFVRGSAHDIVCVSCALLTIGSTPRPSPESESCGQTSTRGGCQIEAGLKSYLLSFPQGGDLSLDVRWSADILVRFGCPLTPGMLL